MRRTASGDSVDEPQFTVLRPAFVTKLFLVFVALAALTGLISIGGRWLGQSIATGGHTEETALRRVSIGRDTLLVPSNMIRFDHARHDGSAGRLDLYVSWPSMAGYNSAEKDTFNHAGGDGRLIFVSFEARQMSRDMSGRYGPIYRKLTVQPGVMGIGNTTVFAFAPGSGYSNETLVVGGNGEEPLVMRCLTRPVDAESVAPCERDIHIGRDLSMTYRMPAELLEDWAVVEETLREFAMMLLETQD